MTVRGDTGRALDDEPRNGYALRPDGVAFDAAAFEGGVMPLKYKELMAVPPRELRTVFASIAKRERARRLRPDPVPQTRHAQP